MKRNDNFEPADESVHAIGQIINKDLEAIDSLSEGEKRVLHPDNILESPSSLIDMFNS